MRTPGSFLKKKDKSPVSNPGDEAMKNRQELTGQQDVAVKRDAQKPEEVSNES